MTLVFFVAWDIIASFFYIGNLIQTENCVTLGTNIVDGLFTGMMTLVMLFLVGAMVSVFIM